MDELNRNELEAVRILWAHGEAKPAEIEARFAWPIDNGTLRSALRGLMEKRLVTRRKVGKAYHYKATKSRQRVLRGMTRRMANAFSGGSAADLIAQLIKTEKLSARELAELRRVAQSEATTSAKHIRKGAGS